ncbi:MAG: hypothetical protein IJ832_02125 [Bacteroidaceae bacterium]|nr:hypothetical protein [Bacteroidaceae bacterium]
MKKYFLSFAIALFALFSMSSCGSDSDSPVDIVTEDSWISRICNSLNIDVNDFYDYWGASGYESKAVVANGMKSGNKIYVAVYDTLKNQVVFTDTYFNFLKSIEANYYENRYTYNLTDFYPTYSENDNGFVIVVNAHYGSDDVMDSKFMQKIIFNDGKQNFYQEQSSYSYIIPYSWFDNSFMLRVRGNTYADCYNNHGELLYKNIHFPGDDNIVPISYSEYIIFGSTNSLDRFQVGRKSIVADELTWVTTLKLIENVTDDMHVTYTCEGHSADIWSFACKIVSRDGTTQNIHFNLDITTGEYSVL